MREVFIDGNFDIPPGTENPQFVVPEEIKEFVINRYGLADFGRAVIDPMAGNGDFPLSVLLAGGLCDAVELDSQSYELARSRIWPGARAELVQGDCTKVAPSGIIRGYHAIWTSPPFELMDQLANTDPNDESAMVEYWRLGLEFDRMLLRGGLLIVDSADIAERNGRTLYPVRAAAEYFRRCGFALRDTHRFRVPEPPEGCDDQFTEIVFEKVWNFPGVLTQLAIERNSQRRLFDPKVFFD